MSAKPYGDAAPDYFRAGWQPIPVGRTPGQKNPPIAGYTGEGAQTIGSIETIRQWSRGPGAARNVGVHLMHPFIGIDVDTYSKGDRTKVGAATLAAAEEALGVLPPTLISSSRTDPTSSGIRVFRLPEGVKSARMKPGAESAITDRFGPDIEVISHAYRYMVVAPSTNPDADGAEYRWWIGGTGTDLVPVDGVPTMDLIADLPVEWYRLLVGGSGRVDTAIVSSHPGVNGGNPLRGAPTRDEAELAELDSLGIDVQNETHRFYSVGDAEAEINHWLNKLASTPKALGVGYPGINVALRDAAAHLYHFVPHFMTEREWGGRLLRAQRDAWVASGGDDDGDYESAKVTIRRTTDVYVPGEIEAGRWWIAVGDPDDDGTKLGKDWAALGKSATERPEPVESAEVVDDLNLDDTQSASDENGGESLAAAVRRQVKEEARLREADQRAARAEQERLETLRKALDFERARREAKAILDEEERHRPVDPVTKGKLLADILTSSELDEIPELEPLIDGWIWKGVLSQIYGPSGHYKSFIASDMARAVCTGERWFGAETAKGPVLYICAEGVQGFKKRIRAMESHRQLGRLADFHVARRAVQIGGNEWSSLIEIVREGGYVMVVVDTQARTTVGRNENDNSDMGEVVAALDELIFETGVGVLMIHHSGKEGADDGRGASAIKGALQTQIRVQKRDAGTVEVKQMKQKDHDELEAVYLQMVEEGDSLVVTANNVADGLSRTDKPVVKDMDAFKAHLVKLSEDRTRFFEAFLHVLATLSDGMGVTKAEITKALAELLGEKETGLRQRIIRAWSKCEGLGYIRGATGLGAAKVNIMPSGCAVIGIRPVRPAWIDPAEWPGVLDAAGLRLDGTPLNVSLPATGAPSAAQDEPDGEQDEPDGDEDQEDGLNLI